MSVAMTLWPPMKRATKAVSGWLKSWRGVPACSIRPLFMMTIRSASAIASSWLWVTWTKTMPSCALQIAQLDPHLHPQEGVERRQRLVEQDDLRLRDQGTGERDALLLPARKLGGQPLAVCLHRDEREKLSGSRSALGFVDSLHLEREGDVVEAGEVREQRIALEHHGRAAFGGRQIGDVGAAVNDVSLARGLMSRDHAQRGSLAAA